MPRKTLEQISAELWRTRAQPPAAPKHLSRDARKLWGQIVNSRTPEYFKPGSLELLAQFCTVSIAQRKATNFLELAPLDSELIKAVKDYAAVLNSTAVKLRIAPSSVYRADAVAEIETPGLKLGRGIGGYAIDGERH